MPCKQKQGINVIYSGDLMIMSERTSKRGKMQVEAAGEDDQVNRAAPERELYLMHSAHNISPTNGTKSKCTVISIEATNVILSGNKRHG